MSPSNRFPPVLAALAVLAVAACAEPITPVDETSAQSISHTISGPGQSHSTGDAPGELHAQLSELRRATASYHNFETAQGAGYAVPITPCWEHTTLGAMGYHYADTLLIDGTVSLLEPEALMYEPGPSGQMRLVGLEYIVPIAAWQGASPPSLLGQELHPHSTLPIYKLHIWLWRDNVRGIFADWNPAVSCDHAADTGLFN